VAYHEHNEDALAGALVGDMRAGRAVALVSDAGTPLVSDPGFPLVRQAVQAGISLFAVPGPSAALAALCVSGLPTARFHFVGFLPDRATRRQAVLDEVKDLGASLIFFSPVRELHETLRILADALGDRPAAVCRELTKIHEEVRRGTLRALADEPLTVLGEAVVVVAPAPEGQVTDEDMERAVESGLSAGESPSALAKRLARQLGLARSAVYERILARKARSS
jgi:16S rRNA (cytidine1402-2'-O)-methyltransferase